MSKLLDGLNVSQQKAVTHTDGPLLILAGPGSGKTHTVARSIAYAIEKRGVGPSRIAAFTFTNKAIDDLKKRISDNIVRQDLVDDIWIRTFHSFCGRVVKEDFDPFGIEDERELTVKELILRQKERVRADIDYIQHRNFPDPDDVLRFITQCKERNINSADVKDYVPHPQMVDVYIDMKKKYEQLNDDGNPYTRVQLLTNALFRGFPEVRRKWQEKFDLIFVDEYQDTDSTQYQIIQTLAGNRQNLRVVGDDDQGIYRWRGADIQNILDFERDYPNAEVISLGQNYRSTQHIVDASRAIIDFNPDRREKNLFTNNTRGYKVKHLHCRDREAEATIIANFICRALQMVQMDWATHDFAVLCRTKEQALPFKEAFSNSDIRHHVVEDLSDTTSKGVSIMTIHKSKGLEFPNVFVAGVCSGLLPHYNSKEKDWDEELRLLYVAMTRAENWLCLSSYDEDFSDQDFSFPRGSSQFLDFIPQSLVERIETLDNVRIPSRLKKRIVLEGPGEGQKYAPPLPIGAQTVLGIDPGKENVGWSITQRLPDAYTVFRCNTEKPYGQPIERKINELVMQHSPDAIAVEKLEGATDEWFRDVAGCVAQIRSIADQRGIECHFYSPQDVKYAVTGNRNALKEEVELAVKKICILKEIPRTDHSADAIAASLCYLRNYLNYSRFQNNVRKQEHYNSGLTYLHDKRYNEAIVEFKEAINNASMIDPMYTKSHCGLASAYIGQGKLMEAENSANEALRLDPDYRLAHEHLEAIKQVYYNRALNYLDNLQYDEAIIEFKVVLNKDSKFIDAHCGLGRVYFEQGNLRKAEDSAKEALKLSNNYQSALYILESIKQKHCELARNYLNNGNLVEAENLAKEALRLDANCQFIGDLLQIIKQAYIDKSNDHLTRGELEEARRAAEQALLLDPNYQPALKLLEKIKHEYYNQGRNHLNNQRYDKSIVAFEATVDRYPRFTAAYCGLSRAYLGKGYCLAAEKSAKEALRLESDYQPALQILESVTQKHCELARDYLNQGDLSAAEKSAKETLRLDGNYSDAHKLLETIGKIFYSQGLAYLTDRAFDNAIESFQRAKDINPTNKVVWTNLGRAYYWINDYANAASCYQKATDIDPNDKTSYTNFGNTYYWMRKYGMAINLFQKAINIDQNCEKTYYYLARAYFKLGRFREAMSEAKKALDITPTYQSALKLLNSIKQSSPALADDIKLETLDAAMILIPRRESQTGNNLRKYQHYTTSDYTVNLPNFYIDKYPVTNKQYKKFLDANPQWEKAGVHSRKYCSSSYLANWNGNNYPSGDDYHPVVHVSWYAAMAYAEWVGKRLPTVTEWKRAAQGDLDRYPSGDSIDPIKVNYISNVHNTTPVDAYPPNGYSLYNMVSNVWEWCCDEFQTSFRALCCGSWNSRTQDVQVASRNRIPPAAANSNFGFRCVKSVTD